MRIRREFAAVGVALSVAVALAATVRATSVTNGGITLTYPTYPLSGPALLSCEPWEEPTAQNITVSGFPDGSTIVAMFAWASPYSGFPNFLPGVTFTGVSGGSLTIPVLYPPDSTQWPLWNPTTNERALQVSVSLRVTRPDGTMVKLASKSWWIRCLPPPAPLQGCTPGYWRQDQHFDSWTPTGYAPGENFETVFGVDASFDPNSLLDAVWLGGGGERALARHAVAALLNAAHPSVNYSYSVAQVIAGVQNAYATGDFESFKDLLDAANNAGCSLN